jgi:hypothetical protein
VRSEKISSLAPDRQQSRGALRQAIVAVLLPLLGLAALDAPAFATGAGAAPEAVALRCTSPVTSQYPARGTRVGILTKTVPTAHVRATAHFKSGNRFERSRAGSTGRQTIWHRVVTATPRPAAGRSDKSPCAS